MTINALSSIFNYKHISIGKLTIAYYALCIIAGAILAYKLSQHHLKKRGYDPKAIENCFYIAFPSGIIGARIWWVIAEREAFFTSHAWYEAFYIWEGGLAIHGGALGGIIAGVTYMVLRHKEVPILVATDCIVPTILLAQALGRWGNFFNQEVYGGCVASWSWLPNFIEDRLTYLLSSSGDVLYNGLNGTRTLYLCEDGQMVLPLFLIEGVLDVAGYFLLYWGIPALFKQIQKWTKGKVFLAQGDISFGYLIVYGTIRAFLEPLRNAEYIMGSTTGQGTLTSVVFSLVYIGIGVVGVVGCHFYHHYQLNKKKTR